MNEASPLLKKIQKLPSYRLILAFAGGSILSAAWYPPFSFLAFVGLVPLLILEEDLSQKEESHKKTFFWLWLLIVIWNIGIYWWLFKAISWLVVAVWFINSGFLASTIGVFRMSRHWAQDFRLRYVLFISFWVGFEYLHLNWSLTWPWANFGHTLASQHTWVQWVEYTGTLGVSVWLLGTNVLFYEAFFLNRAPKWSPWVAILIPLAASLLLYYRYEPQKGTAVECVVVQPNYNCYTQKFENNPATGNANATYVPYEAQVKNLIALSEKLITPQTRYVFWPETALHDDVNEKSPYSNAYLRAIMTDFVKKHGLILISGVDTYCFYEGPENFTPTANIYSSDPNMAYDFFNAAVQIKPNEDVEFYRKSKLVIGAETNPFISILPTSQLLMMFKESWATLGTQEEREVFKGNEGGIVAPVICYESVYGEYVTDYIRKGANLITVITNDGWWDESIAPEQHLNFSVMRAVENRRCIARAANTGISCFIDQRGNILQRSQYGETTSLRASIPLNDGLTFYTKNGDLIGKMSALIAVLSMVAALISPFWKSKEGAATK